MPLTKKEQEKLIVDYGSNLSSKLNLSPEDSVLLVKKSVEGGETEINGINNWAKNRFIPNSIEINKNEYALMCVNALKSVLGVAATDYGSSRQRDLGQMWADMIRGYLGEIAFVKFLKINWNIDAKLDHEKGNLKDFLPMDIHEIQLPGEISRKPKLNISIKTSKWNGIWLDIPGNQFEHSDIHVFVKIGAGRDHLFAFFKEISVFRDKVLKIGEKVGSLSKAESEKLYESLPSFTPIKAYICGFASKFKKYQTLSYTGKKGRINFKIHGWNGPISSGDLEKIKEKEKISGRADFLGIGEFSHDQGYLFNTGNLIWTKAEWNNIIAEI